MSGSVIEFISGSADDARPVLSEAFRYMGCKSGNADDELLALVKQCEKELMKCISPVCCYLYSDIRFISESEVDLGFGAVKSRELSKHLSGCRGAFLFAATIGIGADRLIAKYSRISPAKSVIIDSLGSSAAESWCDHAESIITAGIDKHCSRFSPGYGDLSLSHQTDFMRVLNMNRKLGITLSDSLLMTPTKSVTAIIGIGADNRTCGGKCAACGNISCIYRNE